MTPNLFAARAAALLMTVAAAPAFAAEPAWWTAKKAECGVSMPYNTWVSQGMPCNKGGSGLNAPAASGGLTPQQQLMLNTTQSFIELMIQEAQEEEKREAARRAEREARAAEERRLQEARLEAARQRLQGTGGGPGQLSLKSSGESGALRLKLGDDPVPEKPAVARDNTPACRALAGQINELANARARAQLAGQIYQTYEGNYQSPIAPPGMKNLATDPAEIRKLFPGVDGRKIQELLAPDGLEYRAGIFQDSKTKKILVVFRGTRASSGDDWWKGNIRQALGEQSPYYARAKELASILKASPEAQKSGVEFIGHSLGGGMAASAALEACAPPPGPPQRNRFKCSATTYNASGVHMKTANGTDIPSANGYITSYVMDGEPLNLAQDNRRKVLASMAAAAPNATQGLLAAQDASVLNLPDALPQSIGRRVPLAAWEGAPLFGLVGRHSMETVKEALDRRFEYLTRRQKSECTALRPGEVPLPPPEAEGAWKPFDKTKGPQ